MANFGHKSAVAFWMISIVVHVCFLLNWTSWNFLSVWSVAGIWEKSLKIVSEETEAAFLVWAENVWNSVTGRNGGGPFRH